MSMNRNTPICELAEKYGNRNSTKLYSKDTLICRFMRQWGVDFSNTIL